MCDHFPKPCEHKEVEYCPKCQKVVCKACKKEWGEKEYLPYLPYPYTWTVIVPHCNEASTGITPNSWLTTAGYWVYKG